MAKDQQTKELRRIEKARRKEARRIRVKQTARRILVCVLLIAVVAGLGLLLLRRDYTPASEQPQGALSVRVLDVGQGDAILLQSQGHAALIDAGEYSQGVRVVQQLRALGISHLDYIINSHPHADHIGGMQTVLRRIPADVMILPEIPAALTPTTPSFRHALDAAEAQGVPLHTALCHEILPLGEAQIELLCTDNSAFDNLNDCSLCCRVTCGDTVFFFTGDLGAAGERALLEADAVMPCTVLKVGHHGSASASSKAFLEALHPKIAVISVGAPNDYGHPANSCLSRLTAAGCEIYRTDQNGTLLLTTDGCKVQVTRIRE